MAESHPFANSGLGMYGTAEKGFSQGAMYSKPPPLKEGEQAFNPLGFLAGLIGLSDQKKPTDKTVAGATPPPPSLSSLSSSPYDPRSIAPEVTQQQYINPYQSGYGPNQIYGNKPAQNPVYGGVPMNPQARPANNLNQPNPFGSTTAAQPQSTTSGYHPLINEMWGGR
jgi:hypothetical protein